MRMLYESIRLLEPTEKFRNEFLSMLDELHQTGENLASAEQVRTDFGAYVRRLHEQSQGRDLPAGYVPVSTLWLVKDNQIILGESQLRHSLTPALEAYWGHIGYLIRPSQRRKGYGTLILKLTLDKARGLDIQRARRGIKSSAFIVDVPDHNIINIAGLQEPLIKLTIE